MLLFFQVIFSFVFDDFLLISSYSEFVKTKENQKKNYKNKKKI